MSVSTSYPGIYIQELPSQSHTITPAPTSVTVFIGYTHPFKTSASPGGTPFDGVPLEIFSFTDYERLFGGLYSPTSVDANVAFGVQQFFLNGGSTAYVVGLSPQAYNPNDGTGPEDYPATTGTVPNSNMTFTALEPTDLANAVTITFSNQKGPTTISSGPFGYDTADITITYGSRSEVFRGVSAATVDAVMARSQLVSVATAGIAGNMSTAYPFGLFPPTAASGGGTPGPSAQSHTLDYGTTFAFPLCPFRFSPLPSLPGGMKISLSTPLTVTFKVSTGDWTGVSTPSGYTTADVTITMGNVTEHFAGVKTDPADANYIVTRINTGASASALVSVADVGGPRVFPPTGNPVGIDTSVSQSFPLVTAFPYFQASDFEDVMAATTPLDKLSVFNLLVIPGISDAGVLSTAVAFAEKHRAFLIMDAPALDTGLSNLSVEDIVQGSPPAIGSGSLLPIPLSINAALYYPYLVTPNPLRPGATLRLPPSGFVAGIYARIDQNRGVWKAPAGLETTINNTLGVVPEGVMNDPQQGVLNQIAVNAIRGFPGQGTVVFGARTVLGATSDSTHQAWRYVPVRRMALFIEQTLYANLNWVIFEPNDVPLWNAMKSSVERFMLSLFRQGAFQGTTPSQAFLVKCDSSTTTQDDIDNGRVNILVGFAPLKPAEFVIIQITQLTAQAS